MTTRTSSSVRATMVFGATFALALMAALLGPASVSAKPVELDGGEFVELEGEATILSAGSETQPEIIRTATGLAAALNEGSPEAPASGDDATGLVTVTGPCDGADGAGLMTMNITPGPQLQGIRFDGEDASIVLSAVDGGQSLEIATFETSDTPLVIRGKGAITSPGESEPTVHLGKNDDLTGSLVVGSGATIENTGGYRALSIYAGTCDIQSGASILSDGIASALRVGTSASTQAVTHATSVTISGTVRNPAGMALTLSSGLCTVLDGGRVECDTSSDYIGVQIGTRSSNSPDCEATLVLDGGSIADLAGETAEARTIGVYGNASGSRATFEMKGGELTGGTPSSATIKMGYNSSTDGYLPGYVRISGGTITNPNGGNTINDRYDSEATITGGTFIGGILVDDDGPSALAIEGGTITGAPALEVLSPDATVTVGTSDGDGPALVSGSDLPGAVVAAEGCTATVLGGTFEPALGDATVSDSVTNVFRVEWKDGTTSDIYGTECTDDALLGTAATVQILRVSKVALLYDVAPGVVVENATDTYIWAATPYGLLKLNAGESAVVPGLPADAVTVYRLYNPYLDGAHLLTSDENEVAVLKAAGWQDEGARFKEFPAAGDSRTPVYRLYNPYNGDHFFTASDDEARALADIGWEREGVAWYTPQASTLAAFRLYNPYQTEFGGLGDHLWTTSEDEAYALMDLGWQNEGIGWCCLALK